jgi:hypothetical protein
LRQYLVQAELGLAELSVARKNEYLEVEPIGKHRLLSRFHTGLEVERLNTDALVERLETIGFSIKSFPDIVDMIPFKVLESSPEMTLMSE